MTKILNSYYSKLPKKEVRKLPLNEQLAYYRQCRDNALKQTKIIENAEFRRKIHPILRYIVIIKRIFQGHTIEIIGNKMVDKGKPIIVNISHVCKNDIERVLEAVKKHCYILAGDQEFTKGLDLLFMDLNGVFFVDTSPLKDKTKLEQLSIKKDRNNAKEFLKIALRRNLNVFCSMEGIWNLSRNLPVLDMPWGLIEVADETNTEIVNVAIEQIDKNFIINIGENIDIKEYKSNNQKEFLRNAKNEVRDNLAALKWEIIERQPLLERANIDSEKYYNDWVKTRLTEFPDFTEEIIAEREYIDPNYTSLGEILADLYGIDYESKRADYNTRKKIVQLIDSWTKPVKVK